MKKLFPLFALVVLISACGPKWQEQQADGYKLIVQKKGPTLGYTTAPILSVQGRAFKDLNRNGELDPYENWRRPAYERAVDLASRLTIEEIAAETGMEITAETVAELTDGRGEDE